MRHERQYLQHLPIFMTKSFLLLALCSLTISCQQRSKPVHQATLTGQKDTLINLPPETDNSKQTQTWTDSLISNYIQHTSNDLIKVARNSKMPIEWLYDQAKDTDTAHFLIYQIGHDMTDEEGTNPRFVTDGWIYIDSLTKKLYEYDLPNDSLIPWHR